MRFLACVLSFSTCVSVGPATAAGIGESPRLICAIMEAVACRPGTSCMRQRADESEAFVRIDLEQKTVTRGERTSPILFLETHEKTAQLLLQGNDTGFGWMFTINKKTAAMMGTVIQSSGTFVSFGSCTPL